MIETTANTIAIDRLVFVSSAELPKRQPLLALCGKWLNAELGDATGLLARSGDHALVVLEIAAERAALVRGFLRRPESQQGSRVLLDESAAFRWFSAGLVGVSTQLDAEQLLCMEPNRIFASQVMCAYTAKLSSSIEPAPIGELERASAS